MIEEKNYQAKTRNYDLYLKTIKELSEEEKPMECQKRWFDSVRRNTIKKSKK